MKITLAPHQRAFFTSDTHYDHTNICRGVSKWQAGTGQRDFDTLEQMNDTIVDSLNSLVRPDDILFHLGDWSFGGIEKIWQLRKRIACKTIHLILGNHDHHVKKNKVLPNVLGDSRDELFGVHAQSLFASVSKMMELEIVIPAFDDSAKQISKRFVLCHYPLASWEEMNQGVIHLHGHVHLPEHLKLHEGKAMDVGVDGNGFQPYSLQEIARIMRNQPIARLTLPNDHHEKSGR